MPKTGFGKLFYDILLRAKISVLVLAIGLWFLIVVSASLNAARTERCTP
ncbi:MAG: hypothetical protein LBT09_15035 [Planctomycetaceae bacterium]|nr:hypothetical protein [Planctomycetaceae bacterium]